MVREEGKKEKMRTRLGRKAMGYEEKLKKRGGGEWVRKCWEEVKRRGEEGGSKWERQKRDFYRERGVSTEWVKTRREEEREEREEIEGRDIEVQQQERFERGRSRNGIDGTKR